MGIIKICGSIVLQNCLENITLNFSEDQLAGDLESAFLLLWPHFVTLDLTTLNETLSLTLSYNFLITE